MLILLLQYADVCCFTDLMQSSVLIRMWQIIAEKCRAFVYTEDESQVAPSVASGTAGREMMEYDPLKLSE